MTELQQLSVDVAAVEGIEPMAEILLPDGDGVETDYRASIWLHEDSARCFEIMCKYDMQLYPSGCADNQQTTDKAAATRVAILRARLAIG